ncbi:MAG: LysM peptidoglycan-binding domain-containing protein [Bacteroidales bacterium]|nr:LysM peptidoglycan-binding domain-containing protein [Bacteroidales bacterium]
MIRNLLIKFCFSALLALLLTSVTQGQFQPAPVVKSEQIIFYQGARYYLHSVLQGHTLYRISLAYEVSREDIAAANPDIVLDPLPVGIALKIPVREEQAAGPETGSGFILHTVKPQETAFSLMREYNVPVETIYKYNPGSREGIKIGEVIRIPKEVKTSHQPVPGGAIQQPVKQNINPAGQDPFLSYMVKPGDTLYRISKLYNISISDLIALNPDLRWGLKAEQVLKIPNQTYFPGGYSYYDEHVDTMVTVMDFTALTKYQCDSIEKKSWSMRPVKVAVLLPFFAREMLSPGNIPSDSSTHTDKGATSVFKGRVAAELYEGLLLAVDSLGKEGYNISLAIYDTEADTNRVAAILSKLDIFEPDIIIGPLAPENIALVSSYSFERKIPLVTPLATEDYLFSNNPFMFRVIPTEEYKKRALVEFLAKKAKNRNLVLAYKNSLKYKEEIDQFKAIYLAELLKNPITDTLRMAEVHINDSLPYQLGKALHPDKENLVLIYSEYEGDVISALSQLHSLNQQYSLQILGLPVWQKFENIRIDVIHELQVTLLTPFFIDYNDKATKEFILKCREKLSYEPYKTTSKGTGINYTYLGYDLGMYFIQNSLRYTRKLCDCAQYSPMDLLLSKYEFKRDAGQGSIENSSFEFIKYMEDYTVRILEKPKADASDIILYNPN